MEPYGELLLASGKSLNVTLNKAGSAGFNYPMDAIYAEYVEKYISGVMVFRDGKPIWSGYVLTIDEDPANNTMRIECVGWLQRLERRFLRQSKTYEYVPGVNPPVTATATDDADVIYSLLDEVNFTSSVHASGVTSAPTPDGEVLHWPAGSLPNTPTWIRRGQKLPNEGPGGATAYVPAMRGPKYEKYQRILPAFEDLMQGENGCEILVDPVTRELNIYRKRRVIRDDIHFDFQTGQWNVQNFGRASDGSSQSNYHVTSGSPGITPQSVGDVELQQIYGPLEGQDAFSDILDTNVLKAYSANEVIFLGRGEITHTVTPFPADNDRKEVPRPFDDYDIGDQVRMSALHLPRINIVDQAVRVFGLSITIDEEGNEILGALQLRAG
jgi:hypothetical protein